VRLARAHAFGANLRVAAALYRQAIAEADPESATRAEAEEGLAVALMRMLKDLPTAASTRRTRRSSPSAWATVMRLRSSARHTRLSSGCAATHERSG
jgi:hypothetical protein